jgi:hypothetical protein
MPRKLLSTSSLRAVAVAQAIERAKNIYSQDAVLLKKMPKGTMPAEEAQFPDHVCYHVLDLRGYYITSLVSPNYYSAVEHVQWERIESPVSVH